MGLGFSTKTALTLEFLKFWRFLNNEKWAKMQAVHRPKHWMYEPKNPFLCPIRNGITPIIYMFLFWGWDVSTINATEGFGFLGWCIYPHKNTQNTIPKYYLPQGCLTPRKTTHWVGLSRTFFGSQKNTKKATLKGQSVFGKRANARRFTALNWGFSGAGAGASVGSTGTAAVVTMEGRPGANEGGSVREFPRT